MKRWHRGEGVGTRVRRTAGIVAGLAVAIAACGQTATSTEAADASNAADVGGDDTAGGSLASCALDRLVASPAQITLGGAATITTFGETTDPLHALVAFRHAEAEGVMKYGAFQITEHDATPWVGATQLTDVDACPVMDRAISHVNAKLADQNGKELGTFTASAPGLDKRVVRVTATASDKAMNRASLAWKCQPGEHFIGLGGQSWDVDHRGQTVPLWVSEDGISKLPTDVPSDTWFLVGNRHTTHTPMPIFLSSRGYAVLLDTNARAVVHLCSDDADAVRLENWQGELKVSFFFGANLPETLDLLTQATGRPQIPPTWAFAPWLDAIFGSDNVRRVAKKLRDNHIPVAAIWSEDWRGGVDESPSYTLDEDWNSDDKLYPDITQLAADLHAWGYRFLTYNNTFLTQGADIYDTAINAGYSIQGKDGKPYIYTTAKFVPGSMLDLSNPDAVAWAKQVNQKGLAQGADGWMADFAEWLPVDIALKSGDDPWLAHNRYPVEYQKLNAEILDPAKGQLAFVRSGWLGSQPLVQVMWAGDQQTDFSQGDGLPSVIPMGLGLGVTGFPYFGSDIGGYMSSLAEDTTTKELWFRWVELGALSPIMRTHHGKSAYVNWNWESDAESTAHLKTYATLHMQLLPYLLAMANVAKTSGMPLMRPLALQYPDFEPGWTRTDQFLLGDRLVVAPVIEKGATSRQVWLPAGTWFPLQGGTSVTSDGKAPLSVNAALAEIPVFVPAGAALLLLPSGIDTPNDVTAGTGYVGLEAATHALEAWLWPGPHMASSLTYAAMGLAPLTDWSGALTTPTWNGQPVTLSAQSGHAAVDITLDATTGTLKIGDGAWQFKGVAGDKFHVLLPASTL